MYFEVFGVVVGVFEYLLSLIAPSYDVIECTFKFYPRLACHGITLSEHIPNINKQV